MNKTQAKSIAGSLTSTSKMPCDSYSLPTLACKVGFKMSKIAGSICSMCYANKGFYSMYASTVEPAQHARLDSIPDPDWVDAMVILIGSAPLFRWHDSGDLQDAAHLGKIAEIARQLPDCKFWLPTREYSIVKQYCADNVIPSNLTIRLSAMYPDVPVVVPKSLQGVKGIAVSNVHRVIAINSQVCPAPNQAGKCGDCRACWSDKPVSYKLH